ncbi:DEAD/DEAH box helicase [Aeromonas caviae]
MFSIKNIKESSSPEDDLLKLIGKLHSDGPIDNNIIENITYYKIFHPDTFTFYEEKIISTLGLFYKNAEPKNLYSFILSSIGHNHKKRFGEYLTPVQASVRTAVESKQFVSISAPTSAGKSFSIRDYIFDLQGDCVIIVPSRALIAEYIKTMRDKFKDDKSVMISSFVDYVFTKRQLRRIFILTPERARELFTSNMNLNISLFFFDEAQVSEEKERGVIFDVLVRRIQKHYPVAKLIFAHPFVDNPEAQFKKHSINEISSYSRSYPHNTVGKIFVFGHKNRKDYYFSPYIEKGHRLNNCIELDSDFERFAFDGKKSVLVFVSKASLYRGDFLDSFKKFFDHYDKITNKRALEIVKEVENVLGANDNNHKSKLVELLRIGVVIHHGSVPLNVRFLIEDFIREGFAKICFATSTLAQGINMPFDIVWLDNMRMQGESEEDKSLAFKNLIGRSGRLSKKPTFDFGFVYTNNAKLLSSRVNSSYHLSETSLLESDADEFTDEKELVSSIIDGTFNEDINLPQTKIERLSNEHTFNIIKQILDLIYGDEFGKKLFGHDNKGNRDIVRKNLRLIYEASLGRELFDGELNVFNTAIVIFFNVIRGRPFKEIVGLRYNDISNRDGDRNAFAKFTQPANKLPDSTLTKAYSLFQNGTKAKDVSYDAIVFDTYDYLDTVIAFSLSDVLIGAFYIYHSATKDSNALKMIELLKYGTNNTTHTLLIRYGFPPDDLKEISEYIDKISEENILFKPDVIFSSPHIQELVEWYLP